VGQVEKFLIFLGMALVTFFTRYFMIAALGQEIPPRIRRWLSYVPTAVLAALIAPAALAPTGKVQLGLQSIAVLAGALVAWRTRNVFYTILGGMTVFWVLKLIFGQ
jgi:branched-subunit amino acid transport protein